MRAAPSIVLAPVILALIAASAAAEGPAPGQMTTVACRAEAGRFALSS